MDGLNVAAELLADDAVRQQLLLHPLGVGLRLVTLIHRHDDGDWAGPNQNIRTRTSEPPGAPALLPLAFLACWTDSTVWFMTPSSAATTSTTMSVALAPRALMEEKAAWPGVSRKVIRSPVGSWTGGQKDRGQRSAALHRRMWGRSLPAGPVTQEGSDVLRDAAGLHGDQLALPQAVQQRRLPVIHMTHDSDHRGATRQERGVSGGPGVTGGSQTGQLADRRVRSGRVRFCRYLLWASLLGRSRLSLSLAHLNFIPDRITASLIQLSSRTESGRSESRSAGVLSSASRTWSVAEPGQ